MVLVKRKALYMLRLQELSLPLLFGYSNCMVVVSLPWVIGLLKSHKNINLIHHNSLKFVFHINPASSIYEFPFSGVNKNPALI